MEDTSSCTSEEGPSTKRLHAAADLLSSLPDDLLLHILSFLAIDDAARTVILSRRWRALSTSILNFDMGTRGDGDDASEFVTHVYSSLLTYADKASNISKFRVRFSHRSKRHEPDIDFWINFAARKGVQELHLDLCRHRNDRDEYKLPFELLNCKTLTVLKLEKFKVKSPGFMGLASLASLSLVRINLSSEFVRRVLDWCPVLEDLVLECCRCPGRLVISSSGSSNSRLRRLTIEGSINRGIEIRALRLKRLVLCGLIHRYTVYRLNDVSFLKEAHLGFSYATEKHEDVVRFHRVVRSLLKQLSHAPVLNLSNSCLEIIPLVGKMSTYRFNTKCLVLMLGFQKGQLEGMLKLLKCLPFLETLTIKLTSTARNIDALKTASGESLFTPFSRIHRLKTIEIIGCLKEKQELSDISKKNTVESFVAMQAGNIALVSFLLKNAMVLEKMLIRICERPHWVKLEEWTMILTIVIEKVKAITRLSSSARVLFSHD